MPTQFQNPNPSNITYDYLSGTNCVNGVIIKNGTQTTDAILKDFSLSGHIDQIASTASGQPSITTTHEIAQIGRRQKTAREDGAFWNYGYNDRSGVTSASRTFADLPPMPLDQFTYAYDNIGNRLASTAGVSRESKTFNQLTTRTHVGRIG